MGTTVQLDVDGSSMPCYVSKPAEGGKHPAVIVIQEIFGVNDKIRAKTDLVGAAGFIAIAPAVFHRTNPDFEVQYSPQGRERGRAAAAQVTAEGFHADVDAVLRWLHAQPDWNGKTATWGFCFGGSLAFLSASFEGIDAACVFYGGQIAKGPQFIRMTGAIEAPLFLVFGGQDQGITPADVAAIEAALEAHRKAYELTVYPDEDHGFFRHNIGPDSTPGARDVWPKVRAFFQRELETPVAA